MGVALIAYFPGFHALTAVANPALERAAQASPVSVAADPGTCQLQFNLLKRKPPQSACDVMRTTLADSGVPYQLDREGTNGVARAYVGGTEVAQGTLAGLNGVQRSAEAGRIAQALGSALKAAGYPPQADREAMNLPAILGILLLFMLASTALYGPQAAALVELFPTSVRYTALSVPYNIGTGWIGGLLPVSAFAIVAATGNIYAGLYYPFFFTAVSFICCWLWLPETAGKPLQMTGGNHARQEPLDAT
jgi:hypothetical protein